MTCKDMGRMSYLDSGDLLETTSDSTIESVVLGRFAELIEILLVEEALCRRQQNTPRPVILEKHGAAG